MNKKLLRLTGALVLTTGLVACGGGGSGTTVSLPEAKGSVGTATVASENASSSAAAAADAAAPVAKATTVLRVPLYRFFNTHTNTHFYTSSVVERDRITTTYPQFQLEGTGYYAYADAQPGTSAVYRFYNVRTGTHFYTIGESERDSVRNTMSETFNYEGVAWYGATTPAADNTPIYRFYNTSTGAHFYTVSAQERAQVIARYPQFSNEGIGYYAWLDTDGAGGTATQPSTPTLPLSPTYSTVNLSVTGFTPGSITSQSYQSDVVPNTVTLTGKAAGDFSILANKTLYVLIDDPDSLFKPNPQVIPFYSNSQGGVAITLQPNNKRAGTYRGNLKIYACLDSICSVRLGNVPFSIPYDVVVKRNTTFDANGDTTIGANTPFSGTAQKVALRINPAEGTTMSGWELVPYYSPLNVKSALRYDGDGKGTLTLEVPAAAPPGKYTLRYGFWTKSGAPYVPPISLTVNLEVIQPADTPYVFDPPTQTITSQLVHGVMYRTDGFSLVQGQGTMALASPGAEEILYTAEQQAAIPAEKRARFIEVTRRDYQPNPSTSLYLLNHSACIRTYETTPSGEPINYCLPPGNYAFRIKFNFTVNGSTTPAEYLGTLAVTP